MSYGREEESKNDMRCERVGWRVGQERLSEAENL